MIYLLLFIAATLILLYVTSRWLRGELRELRAWLDEKWVVRRGGESQASLIDAAERAFQSARLNMEFLIVSRQVMYSYGQLRRQHIERIPSEPLPVAVVFALGADTGARRLYLRTVEPRPDRAAADNGLFVDFDEVRSVELVARATPEHSAPAGDQALELDLGGDRPKHHLHIEPDWSISAEEIARRIRGLLSGDWRPENPPALVR